MSKHFVYFRGAEFFSEKKIEENFFLHIFFYMSLLHRREKHFDSRGFRTCRLKFKNFGPFFDLRIIFSLGDIDLDLEEIIDQVPLDVV